jgi:hypothetical protein
VLLLLKERGQLLSMGGSADDLVAHADEASPRCRQGNAPLRVDRRTDRRKRDSRRLLELIGQRVSVSAAGIDGDPPLALTITGTLAEGTELLPDQVRPSGGDEAFYLSLEEDPLGLPEDS